MPIGNSPFGSAVGLLPGLVFTPDVEAAALVGHQLSVGLHHDRVEVLDRVVLLKTATRDVRNSCDFNYDVCSSSVMVHLHNENDVY